MEIVSFYKRRHKAGQAFLLKIQCKSGQIHHPVIIKSRTVVKAPLWIVYFLILIKYWNNSLFCSFGVILLAFCHLGQRRPSFSLLCLGPLCGLICDLKSCVPKDINTTFCFWVWEFVKTKRKLISLKQWVKTIWGKLSVSMSIIKYKKYLAASKKSLFTLTKQDVLKSWAFVAHQYISKASWKKRLFGRLIKTISSLFSY